MKQNDVCMYVCMYVDTIVSGRSAHSRKNAHPLLNYFSHRVKVYLNKRPPWSELCVEFEKHSAMHI